MSSTADGSIQQEEIIPMLGCRACHRFSTEGSQLGPSLVGIGQRRTRGELRNTLMPRDETEGEHHMPSYAYLSEEELQQLLNVLEQQ
jgi:cbb3-type cytochrome oxidase cytochrome c subunit